MSEFYSLKIADIKALTQDATSIAFEVPDELWNIFSFKPGQYLTLKFTINGEEVRRSYSLCNSPLENELRVGVKRVENGLVSNYIPDNLQVGDTVEVMPPNGLFFAEVKPENYKTYYLFAGGSGITPILSILKTVLWTERKSYVYMIFGNQHQDSIMFLKELQELQEQYADRFFLVHSLSRAKGLVSSMFSENYNLDFRKGRIDKEAIEWFINEYQPYAQNVEYYICGPAPMIDGTVKALKSIDVPQKRIFIERFSADNGDGDTQGVEAQLTARINNEKVSSNIAENQTILRSLIEAGYTPPYSCEGGVCSTCICKLTKGEVHMKNNIALSEQQVSDGYILSCQALAQTEVVEVEYPN